MLSIILEKELWKKKNSILDLTLHLYILQLLWNFLKLFLWNTCTYTDRAFYLTDVKLAHTSTHTNKSFLSLVSIKSFESSQLFLNLVQNFEKTVMTQKLMRLDVSRNVQFTLKFRKVFISRIRGHSKNMLVQNDRFLNPSPSNPSFVITKTLKTWQLLVWIRYVTRSIRRQQLFRYLRAH